MFKSTRFVYSMFVTSGIFILMWFDKIPKEHFGNALLVLTAVVGLFGATKIVEKLKGNVTYGNP